MPISHVPFIQQWFDLHPAPHPAHPAPESRQPFLRSIGLPAVGQLWLIQGPSGSGKSRLLRQFARHAKPPVIWPDRLPLPDLPIIDCFDDPDLDLILSRLSRLGLAEATTYLRRPAQLSKGQRQRLRLALALHHLEQHPARPNTSRLVLIDEFVANLDRISAALVARTLRRAIVPSSSVSAIVATCHDDLLAPLAPDQIIRADFDHYHIVVPPAASMVARPP